MPYEVPPLPYDYNALEPHIDEQTMRLHHDKHHQAYVDNANKALAGTEWGSFVDMYEPASPWHDQRVRLAANHALNRQALNDAETLGYSKLLGGIIPETYDFALPLEPYAYDPPKAKALLTAAGYPQGFDAGTFACDAVYASQIEGVVNDLGAVGRGGDYGGSGVGIECGDDAGANRRGQDRGDAERSFAASAGEGRHGKWRDHR